MSQPTWWRGGRGLPSLIALLLVAMQPRHIGNRSSYVGQEHEAIYIYTGLGVIVFVLVGTFCVIFAKLYLTTESRGILVIAEASLSFLSDNCILSIHCRSSVTFVLIIGILIPTIGISIMWHYFIIVSHITKKELKLFNARLASLHLDDAASKQEDDVNANDHDDVILNNARDSIEEYRMQHGVLCHVIGAINNAFCIQIGAFLAGAILVICLSLLCLAKSDGHSVVNQLTYVVSVHNIIFCLLLMLLLISRGVAINDLVCIYTTFGDMRVL